jgi:hypothetical protein
MPALGIRTNENPFRRARVFLATVAVVLYTGAALLLVAISLALYSMLQAIR